MAPAAHEPAISSPARYQVMCLRLAKASDTGSSTITAHGVPGITAETPVTSESPSPLYVFIETSASPLVKAETAGLSIMSRPYFCKTSDEFCDAINFPLRSTRYA